VRHPLTPCDNGTHRRDPNLSQRRVGFLLCRDPSGPGRDQSGVPSAPSRLIHRYIVDVYFKKFYTHRYIVDVFFKYFYICTGIL
jgi:hypothetical protein